MKINNIDILNCQLGGSNLIEANAGTGKTYTITALTIRLLIEKAMPIEQILVVTFTKAAVADLKTKIYERLIEMRAALAGKEPKTEFVRDYLKKGLPENAKQCIEAAIRDFDMNGISTIHGFCQKMLTENSFGGNIAFGTKLAGDASALLKRPVQDYWRKRMYSMKAEFAELLTGETPESIISFVKNMMDNPSMRIVNRPDVSEEDFERVQAKITDAFKNVKDTLSGCNIEQMIKDIYDNLNGRTYGKGSVENAFDALTNLKSPEPPAVHKLHLLTTQKIQSSPNKNKTAPVHPLYDAVDEWLGLCDTLKAMKADFRTMIKCGFYDHCVNTLDEYNQLADSQSYTDLIVRMREAVMSGSSMKETLRKRYQAAMIDEFQDTDPFQYDIFHETFSLLFMIGDPKQAIYAFRGADVFTYLKAAENREEQYTLTVNHRSDSGLVEAMNRFFASEKPFCIERIGYNPSAGRQTLSLIESGKRRRPLTLWYDDRDEKPNPAQMAEKCSFEIARILNAKAQLEDKDGKRTVIPSDFAVLTLTNDQALKVRDALIRYRIPCVVTGAENVFYTVQASQIMHFVAALVRPYSEKAVRTALASDIFGFTADEIFNLSDRLEGIFEDFAEFSDIMRTKGIAPVFFRAAEKYRMFTRLAERRGGERIITNFIHLTELLQQYEAEHRASPTQLLLWLTEKTGGRSGREDEYLQKMDSDDNAVNITTVHKSKGLEYNIVFTPFLMYGKKRDSRSFPKYHDENSDLVMDMAPDSEASKAADTEALSESLRLAYVALTRAKAVCYTAYAPVDMHHSSSIGYIINGTVGKDVKYDTTSINKFVGGCGQIALLPLPEAVLQHYAPEKPKTEVKHRIFSGKISESWQMNSFSRLVHKVSYDRDTDQFAPQTEEKNSGYSIFTFPKGAKAGNCLHECMEDIHLENTDRKTVENAVRERLKQYFFDEKFIPAVTENIHNILTRELIDGITLSGIPQDSFVHEMEFSLFTHRFGAEEIADIFAKAGETEFAKAAATLDFAAMQGYLTGFADLIFISGGKFYILDWKSNFLGAQAEDYSLNRMLDEMLNSHYYLQLYIYTLALHVHLMRYMPDYDFDKHIGGGIYIFMRGVEQTGENGIFFHQPKREIIEKMAKTAVKQ